MSKTPATSSRNAIFDVLEQVPSATVEQIAASAGVGRSTVGKQLTQLEGDGKVCRTEGGRDGGRRLPDLWSLAGAPPATTKARNKITSPSQAASRLRAGGLDPLVLSFLQTNAASGPHGPTAIAKALQRSSGAVANCLVRLTDAKKVKLATDRPRRYTLA